MGADGRSEVPRSRRRSGRPGPARRRAGIVAASAAPTLLVLLVLRAPLDVLAVLGGAGTPGSVDPGGSEGGLASVSGREPPSYRTAGAAAAAGAGEPQGRWGQAAERPATAVVALEELRGGWRVESGIEEASALAVIAGHAWADAHGVRVGAEGSGAVMGAIVAVEAVERPGALHAVVTLLVSGEEAVHRIGVPILLGPAGPQLAGPPWSLPAPRAGTVELRGTPTADAELLAAARRALEHIGIPGGRLVALEVTDGWPFIARLDGDTGGHPWLRWHLDRFVVAGLPLDAGDSGATHWNGETDEHGRSRRR
jgi:hypothetical protein